MNLFKIIGLFGESGAGKSTLINILMCLMFNVGFVWVGLWQEKNTPAHMNEHVTKS